MLNNLVIATFLLAVGQPSSGPVLRPITDADAYAIYATLLPRVAGQRDGVILLVQETTTRIRCIPPLPKGWDGVRKDLDRQNATS